MQRKDYVQNKIVRDNRGSAIVTVLIAIAFITMIATTVMYVTVMNYRMKKADYASKKSFYATETALEQVKANIVYDFSKACETAYGTTMSQYAIQNEGNRTLMFRNSVNEDLQSIWNTKLSAYGGDWDKLLEAYAGPSFVGKIKIWKPDPMPIEGYSPVVYNETNGTITLKNVILEYELNGSITMLETDMLITIPALDWSAQYSKTSFDGMDAAAIANALKPHNVDASDCVVYTNWSKN